MTESVGTAAWRSRSSWILATAVTAALAIGAGCSSASRGAGRGDANAGTLVIDCSVADAEVWIDGSFVAAAAQLGRGIALSPGRHLVEVRHDSYHAYYGEPVLTAHQRVVLEVRLVEILP